MPSLDPPSELLLKPGEKAVFRLPGAGSAGYVWNWAIDGDASTISVTINPASPPPLPNAGVFRAGSVDKIVEVCGLHAGSVQLRLALARTLPSSPVVASHTIKVTVAPDTPR